MTFCDFKIRNLGDNIHQHSVQCALPINLFNEKFFIFLWFWLVLLACITIVNFFNWLTVMVPSFRKRSISKYLRSHNKLGNTDKDQEMLDAFVNEFCHLDGAFIFAIIRRNSNYITTSEIICSLWSKYCRDFNRSHPGFKSIVINKNDNDNNIGMIDYDETPEKAPFQS